MSLRIILIVALVSVLIALASDFLTPPPRYGGINSRPHLLLCW